MVTGFLLRLLRLSSTSFAFAAGVFASSSVNLVTSVLVPDTLPMRWRAIVGASALMLLSGFFWGKIAYEVDKLQRLVLRDSPDFVQIDIVWETAVTPKITYFTVQLLLAVGSASVAIAWLVASAGHLAGF